MDQFHHIVAQQVVLVQVVGLYLFVHLQEYGFELQKLLCGNLEDEIALWGEDRKIVELYAHFGSWQEVLCKDTEMPRLLRTLVGIVVRDFWRGKKDCAIFDVDDLVGVFHPVLPLYQTDLVISPSVIRHFGFGLAGPVYFGNVKDIEMANVLVDVFREEQINVWTRAAQDLLVKFFDGY